MKLTKLRKRKLRSIEDLKEVDPKKFNIKKMTFHRDFDKGWRLAVCLRCSYPYSFAGSTEGLSCACKTPRWKVYSLNKLDDFILKLQELWTKKNKVRI